MVKTFSNMKYYLIAGEASGDLHGSFLIRSILKRDPEAIIRMWGGDKMQAAGGELVKHYRDLAFMGFAEVLLNLRTILGNIRLCKEDIIQFQPDRIIYIDYPGFNLRIAHWAKKKGFTNFYYISPQIWAWHSSRVHRIRNDIDRMFVILPFEKAFYKKYGMEVDFVGHPLLDTLKDLQPDPTFRFRHNLQQDTPLVALLPGSRKQEIKRMLEVMIGALQGLEGFQFALACAPSQEPATYLNLLKEMKVPDEQITLIENDTYGLLQAADAALVTSGTATLETALLGVPQVVCYKGNGLSYQIARRLIQVRFISLVNLIIDREVVSELIQDACTPEAIRMELNQLFDPVNRQRILSDYQQLKSLLGSSGSGAADRVAAALVP